MAKHEFLMKLSRRLNGPESNAAYDAGFDDSLLGGSRDGGEIDVNWEAATREDAIEAATKAIKEAAPGIEVTGIENITPLD